MRGKGMGKRRVGNTVVSLLLTFAMLLTSSGVTQLGGITVSAEDSWTDTGLITNGDFETCDSSGGWDDYSAEWTKDMTSWENYSSHKVNAAMGEGYIHSQEFYNGDSSNTATMSRTISDVEAGTYQLVFDEMGNGSAYGTAIATSIVNASADDASLASSNDDSTSVWNE